MKAKLGTGPVMAVLFAGVLLGAMDIAIIGPAMPLVRKAFSVSDRDLSWILTIYILFNLVATPLMARRSDLLGRKAVYVSAVAVFAAGSVLAAAAPSFGVLLAARGLQGAAAGGFMPVASAVIGDIFPPERRGRGLGLIGAVFGIAFIVGPIVGAMVMPLGWRWLFWINLPLALLVGGAAFAYLPGKVAAASGRFDLPGALLLAVSLSSFAFGVNRIDTGRFFTSLVEPGTGLFILAGLLLFVPLVLIERRASLPIVPIRLLSSPRLLAASVVSFAAGVVELAGAYLAQLAAAGYGIPVERSSFFMLPFVLGMTIGAPTSGRLLDKVGPRAVIGGGSILLAVGMAGLGWTGSPLRLFLAAQLLGGVGLSAMLGAPIRYVFLEEAAPEDRSAAQGLATLESSAGMLIGGAAVGAVISSSGGGEPGLRSAFLIFAAIALLCIVAATATGKRRAAEGSAA